MSPETPTPRQYANGLAIFLWFSSTYRNWNGFSFRVVIGGLGDYTSSARNARKSKSAPLIDHSLHIVTKF